MTQKNNLSTVEVISNQEIEVQNNLIKAYPVGKTFIPSEKIAVVPVRLKIQIPRTFVINFTPIESTIEKGLISLRIDHYSIDTYCDLFLYNSTNNIITIEKDNLLGYISFSKTCLIKIVKVQN